MSDNSGSSVFEPADTAAALLLPSSTEVSSTVDGWELAWSAMFTEVASNDRNQGEQPKYGTHKSKFLQLSNYNSNNKLFLIDRTAVFLEQYNFCDASVQ
jgi:hypothetical protein